MRLNIVIVPFYNHSRDFWTPPSDRLTPPSLKSKFTRRGLRLDQEPDRESPSSRIASLLCPIKETVLVKLISQDCATRKSHGGRGKKVKFGILALSKM